MRNLSLPRQTSIMLYPHTLTEAIAAVTYAEDISIGNGIGSFQDNSEADRIQQSCKTKSGIFRNIQKHRGNKNA